jgi:4,5-DOPA dioxygenase extradiol
MARMPSIFFGHGNPMNALMDTAYSRAWRGLGRELPRPAAILCVSAHWYAPELAVTAMPQPRTIHDFGGFPRALFEVKYPAPGSPALAQRVRELLAPDEVRLDERGWGLDHGTWSVLCHLYPGADVPVVQLSIDETRPARWHYSLAQRLAPLREERVLVIGSGNVVHNLHAYAWGRHDVPALDWAVRFERTARELITRGEHSPLIEYEQMGADAMLSAPTPDHYLPLLYVLAQQRRDEAVSFPVEGFDGGSVSMLAVRTG